MPTPATCVHCGNVVHLPDGWTQPGFTCPRCNAPTTLPLPLRPAPVLILPPPPEPFAFDSTTRVEHHSYDHSPRRSSFGAAFGAGAGCVLGVAFGMAALIGIAALFCAGGGGLLQPFPPR